MAVELQSIECPECGAPLPNDVKRCAYCNSWLREAPKDPAPTSDTRDPAPASDSRVPDPSPKRPRLALGEREFGLSGWWPAGVAAAGAAVLYGIGWLLEDPTYWLDQRAIAVWAVLLPLWQCAIALVWRAPRRGWLPGLLIAATIFTLHLAIPWWLGGRINDDLIGIGGAFAGGALAGWLAGRLLHYWIRLGRPRRQVPNRWVSHGPGG